MVLVIILEQIESVLESILTFYHDHGVSWGWSIVLLTFTVRLAILPLTIKQFRSMAAMQELQPKLKSLQAKYKDKKSPEDKRKMQQEMMALYRENNVNPFGSCLPLLFQLPVFFGLFQVLNNFADSNPGGSPAFLGIDNIFVNLSETSTATQVMVAGLYLGSMLGATLLFSFVADKQQRYLFAGMSVLFVFFILQVPVGVGIYWITTNLWTIAQQGIIKQTMGHRFAHIRKEREEASKRTSRSGATRAKAAGGGGGKPKPGGRGPSRKAKRKR
jgi:YidC/Oxa1 family membrane protein insertase